MKLCRRGVPSDYLSHPAVNVLSLLLQWLPAWLIWLTTVVADNYQMGW